MILLSSHKGSEKFSVIGYRQVVFCVISHKKSPPWGEPFFQKVNLRPVHLRVLGLTFLVL